MRKPDCCIHIIYIAAAFADLEHFDIIHITLPVFDKAVVIGSHHPVTIMAPYHRPNSRIVCLTKGGRQLAGCDRTKF